MVGLTTERDVDEIQRVQTLGSVRLQKRGTRETILIPTPSADPNDPLNWSNRFRYYIAGIVCAAVFFCNFLAAGPTVAIVEITIDFFGTPPPQPTFFTNVAKVAYFFTTTALMQGMSNLLWMPIIVKYGRRPAYLISFTLYTATAIWSGVSKSYGSELAARIVMGLAAGSGECVAPLTIADTFFLHERGTIMACYTTTLSCGVSGGIIIAGLITINHSWRYIYYVATALIGGLTILVFLTMPETSFSRSPSAVQTDLHKPSELYTPEDTNTDTAAEEKAAEIHGINHVESLEAGSNTRHKQRSYVQGLRIFNGKLTNESLVKIFIRPVALLLLPPVLWATLVMSVTIGFLVAISSNFASAFSTTYDFLPWQSGLCFISGIIGSLLGLFAGGHLSDWIANKLTQRNGGIREPEMRLPAVSIGLIASPLALVLYGVGIEKQLHWIVPTIGLGLLSFAIAQVTNVTLVYTVDAYRPVAGEVVVSQLGFKAAFGFLLSFYTNPWITRSGYGGAFGTMAGISGAVLLMWIPFYMYGKRIRVATNEWRIMKSIQWDVDREVGE